MMCISALLRTSCEAYCFVLKWNPTMSMSKIPIYHTWVWNREICRCVIVRPRSHKLIVRRKIVPFKTIKYSIFFLVHSAIFSYISQYLETTWHLVQNSYIYYYYFCEIEKHTGSFLSSSTSDPDLGGFPQGWGVKCFVHGLYILQTGMHAWHFEHIVAPWQEIQSLAAHTNPPV